MQTENIKNIQLSGIFFNDHPDYTDAYIVSGEIDGKDLTEAQLDEVNADSDFIHEKVLQQIY